jgi:O-antigen ligase
MTWFKQEGVGLLCPETADTSSGIRLDLWKTAVQAIGEHPIAAQALRLEHAIQPAST